MDVKFYVIVCTILWTKNLYLFQRFCRTKVHFVGPLVLALSDFG